MPEETSVTSYAAGIAQHSLSKLLLKSARWNPKAEKLTPSGVAVGSTLLPANYSKF